MRTLPKLLCAIMLLSMSGLVWAGCPEGYRENDRTGECESLPAHSSSAKTKANSRSVEIKYSNPIWASKNETIDCCTEEGMAARLATYRGCIANAKQEGKIEIESGTQSECATACVAYGISIPFKETDGRVSGCIGIAECDETLRSNQSAIRKVDAKQIELKILDVATFRRVINKDDLKNTLLVAAANESLFNGYSYFKVLYENSNQDTACHEWGYTGSISSSFDGTATYSAAPSTTCAESSIAFLRVLMFNDKFQLTNGITSLHPKTNTACVVSNLVWETSGITQEGRVWQDVYMLDTATTYRAEGLVEEFAPALGLSTDHNPNRIGYGYSPESKTERLQRLLAPHVVD